MSSVRGKSVLCAAVAVIACLSTAATYAASPSSTYEAITRVADHLVATQNKNPADLSNIGAWPGESGFTGSIVAGLADAYAATGDQRYKDAAELGGQWILDHAAGCDYYGDEAYALMRLSQISCNPASNTWRTHLQTFYACAAGGAGGTQGYINDYWAGSEICTSVFYLAHHTVAAYYVNAADKNIWRSNLIKFLSRVNGYQESSGETLSQWPVYALGVATWAICEIQQLNDNSYINSDGGGDQYWGLYRVKDMPAILKTHRSSETNMSIAWGRGTFYCWFDHLPAGAVGYTEDSIFGLLGLATAQSKYSQYNYSQDVLVVWSQLLDAIDDYGSVWGHVDWNTYPFQPYYYYGGEMLTVLCRSTLAGDINLNDSVNGVDLGVLVGSWLTSSGCDCDVADLSRDKFVNFTDFAILAQGWMKTRTPLVLP